jgi:hypothetical protein
MLNPEGPQTGRFNTGFRDFFIQAYSERAGNLQLATEGSFYGFFDLN